MVPYLGSSPSTPCLPNFMLDGTQAFPQHETCPPFFCGFTRPVFYDLSTTQVYLDLYILSEQLIENDLPRSFLMWLTTRERARSCVWYRPGRGRIHLYGSKKNPIHIAPRGRNVHISSQHVQPNVIRRT
jgi:hypothetical protein